MEECLTLKWMLCKLSSNIDDESLSTITANDTAICAEKNLRKVIPLPGVNIEKLYLILLCNELPKECQGSVNWEQLFEL